jgi:hypothetical protein
LRAATKPLPEPSVRRQPDRSDADADVPVAAPQGVQGDVHGVRSVLHDTLEFVPDRSLEPGTAESRQFGDQVRHPVHV